jgi:ATP-dependent Clp protease ATP-binding subunit ClpC
MEKAHPDVFNMLLQILEDGQLTDAKGRKVSFRNTVIIGTSNLCTGSLSPDKRPIGFIHSDSLNYKETQDLVMHEVKKFFKPEFLNRLDDIIVFHYLEKDHVHQIAEMFVAELVERMKLRGIVLEVDNAVIDKLSADGFDPIYGARPLRREVERQIENVLAMKIVRNEFSDNSVVQVKMQDKKIVFITEQL